MFIRHIKDPDVAQACALLNRIIDIGGTTAYERPLSEDDFRSDYVTDPDLVSCLVCQGADGDILGFQSLRRLPDRWADIASFARTTPKTPGVGRLMFASTREQAREAGITTINATIRADNVPGLAYYAKMGFVDYGVNKAVPLSSGRAVDRVLRKYVVDERDG